MNNQSNFNVVGPYQNEKVKEGLNLPKQNHNNVKNNINTSNSK